MSPTAPLRVRVAEVVRETADAHTFVLEPEDAGRAGSYRPGQFLTVRIPSDRGSGAARCYSLSSSPHLPEPWKLTVKRTAGGYGSNWLCDNVVEGTVLEVLRPAGTFTPRSLDDDVLLFAGGSGITPVLSILKSCLAAGRGAVTLVYANRDEQSVMFRDELALAAKEHADRLVVRHWLESEQGRPTAAAVRALAEPYLDRTVFVCGPAPFMDLVQSAVTEAGVPADRVHVERFTSLLDDPFTPVELVDVTEGGEVSTVEVELDGVWTAVRWRRDRTLLETLRASGIDAPFSCQQGTCSACACVLLEGEVELARNEILDDEELAGGYILGCQARPLTPHLRVTYDS